MQRLSFTDSFKESVRSSFKFDFLRDVNKDEVDENRVKAALRAYRVVLVTGTALIFVYFAMFLTVVIKSFGSDLLGNLAFVSAPIWVVIFIYALLIIGFFKSIVGVIALINSNSRISLWVMGVSSLTLVLAFIVLILAILRGTGVSLFAPEVAIDTLADETQANIVRFAMANPDTWKQMQDDLFKDCCGLNMAANYADQLYGIDNFDIDVFLNGDFCVFNTKVKDIIINNPTYDESVQELVDADAQLRDDLYFCESKVVNGLRNFAIPSAPWIAIVIIGETVVILFLVRLLYRYSRIEGGLREKHEKVGPPKPMVEDTVLKKAGYKQTKPLKF